MLRSRRPRENTMPLMYAIKKKSNTIPILWMAIVMALFWLSACTHMDLEIREQANPVCLNDPVPLQVLELKHFQRNITGHATFFGLLAIKSPGINQALKELIEQYGGNGVINLQLTEKVTFFQGFFDLLLFPLWTSRTYYLEGDVVKILPPPENAPEAGH